MLAKLWADEHGVIATEYLFLVSIVGLGLVVAFSNLETAITAEYTELSNAILGLSQAYAISSQFGCASFRGGSAVTDTPQVLGFGATTVIGTPVDVVVCTGQVGNP